MKLLIFTQKVDKNDSVLGFFHTWITEFSKRCEFVTVICLEEGEHDFSKNAKPRSVNSSEFSTTGVKVLSLGKEKNAEHMRNIRGTSQNKSPHPLYKLYNFKNFINYFRLYKLYNFTNFITKISNKLIYIWKFYVHLWKERGSYDTVFIHMNPEYMVLGGPWWRLAGKKTALWYTHRQVNLKLKIAEFFTNTIFTVATESFKLKSNKIKIVGHGIPVEIFEKPKDFVRKDDKFRLVSVGRITPIKNFDILIEATNVLKKEIPNLEVVIVGGPTQTGDTEYFEKLKSLVSKYGLENTVHFAGSITNDKIREHYWNSDISINLCPTGGVDKVVLESMASGTLVLASNRAFQSYFGEYSGQLLFAEGDVDDLVQKALKLKENKDKNAIINYLVGVVKERSSLTSLITKITEEMK